MDSVARAIDQAYKEHFGKMVGSLVWSFKTMALENAEDIVQDAFTTALREWNENGIPSNAAGWLYRVCRNRALNDLKSQGKTCELTGRENLAGPDSEDSESSLNDHQLKMLFACAHPDLSPKTQVVITLKYVINLRVETIAKMLALTVDGIDKLLGRARKKIQNDSILLSVPSDAALRPRLPIVHKVIYLVFNEGYKTSSGMKVMREELCEEALILTKSLLHCKLSNQETLSLYSLILFHAARFNSRFSADGSLTDLETQDRSKWNSDLIRLGTYYLQQSASDQSSKLQIEASIAYLHCTAATFQSTDWATICKLYSTLLSDNNNPFVELNYAIALYFLGEKEKSFQILTALEQHPYMRNYHLLNATVGRLAAREGQYAKGREYLARAAAQTKVSVERDFILLEIQKLRAVCEN